MKTFLNKIYTFNVWVVLLTAIVIANCVYSAPTTTEPPEKNKPSDPVGKVPNVVAPDIAIVMPAQKIIQLVGEYDREENHPTLNKTYSRYKLKNTDLGVPFRYNNRTYVLFGDTHGAISGNRDAIAYTTDTNPDDGLLLHFIHRDDGVWKPITIPGIEQGAFDVPTEGVEVDDTMYIYATTGHRPGKTMGRSVIARATGSKATFHVLYNFSASHYINLSIVKTSSSNITPSSSVWNLLPENKGSGEGLVIFGSGSYRQSEVYLAYQPTSQIEDPDAIRYFSGISKNGKPLWSTKEEKSLPLFNVSNPCVGELSVTYNSFINRWIMLYNCSGGQRGLNVINIRTAKYPWGPWTKPQILFDPWKDGGYCHFIHVSWKFKKCDSVMDPAHTWLGVEYETRKNVWGGVYGPYQYPHYAIGDSNSTTIYFNMSTWNPYTVVLMKAKLKKKNN